MRSGQEKAGIEQGQKNGYTPAYRALLATGQFLAFSGRVVQVGANEQRLNSKNGAPTVERI